MCRLVAVISLNNGTGGCRLDGYHLMHSFIVLVLNVAIFVQLIDGDKLSGVVSSFGDGFFQFDVVGDVPVLEEGLLHLLADGFQTGRIVSACK